LSKDANAGARRRLTGGGRRGFTDSAAQMNLILFEASEIGAPLARGDVRAKHIVDVLRRREGETFDAGVVNGPRGKGTVRAIGAEALTLEFAWGEPPAALDRIRLIVGLPRPQTARDILRDATTLGVTRLDFVLTEKGEPSYARATLWSDGEWRRQLLAGAAQAFDTRIPEVAVGRTLAETLVGLPASRGRLGLDNYEATRGLSQAGLDATGEVVLAIGPERGWAAGDRAQLRDHGFTLVHLGPRVLRTETAVTAALTLVQARRGRF